MHETTLCTVPLLSGSSVALLAERARFCTLQELPDNEPIIVELDRVAAYEVYVLAQREGSCMRTFPKPVPKLPKVRKTPRLRNVVPPGAQAAHAVRVKAGVTQRHFARAVGVSQDVIRRWEYEGLSPWGAARYRHAAAFARYLELMARLRRGEPLEDPAPADGKRRCRVLGCGAILSRFNADDRCACHG